MLLLNASTGTFMHNLISKVLAFQSICFFPLDHVLKVSVIKILISKRKSAMLVLIWRVKTAGYRLELQVRVAGHCFTMADKTQA